MLPLRRRSTYWLAMDYLWASTNLSPVRANRHLSALA
jgi:hypothetical protein